MDEGLVIEGLLSELPFLFILLESVVLFLAHPRDACTALPTSFTLLDVLWIRSCRLAVDVHHCLFQFKLKVSVTEG